MSQSSKAHDAVGVKAAEEQELPSLSCRPRWGSLRRWCKVGRAGRAAGAAVLPAGVAACPKVLPALMLVWKGPAVSRHLFRKFELGSADRISGIFRVRDILPSQLNPVMSLCGLTGFGAPEWEEEGRSCGI